MQGLQETLAYSRGDKSAAARVVHIAVKLAHIKTARKRTGMSREAFARAFGLSPATLRNWENVERQPTSAARILLTIISREPEAALRAVR
jgi:putative transcriptional regulator